jgi:hypothetical protein
MKESIKQKLIESLIKMGGKKTKDAISFIKPSLTIKHKEVGVKYTIQKIFFNAQQNPFVLCYRYYTPTKNIQKKVFIVLDKDEFKNYEPV